MKHNSAAQVNQLVNEYLSKVKEINNQIVSVTQKKEAIESKMKQEVDDDALKQLQAEHGKLIKEYQGII